MKKTALFILSMGSLLNFAHADYYRDGYSYSYSNPQYHDGYYRDGNYSRDGYHDGYYRDGYNYRDDRRYLRDDRGYYRDGSYYNYNDCPNCVDGNYDYRRNYYYDSRNQYGYQQNPNASVSDIDLEKKIGDALKSGLFSRGYEQVHFQVQNGNVILSGNVQTNDDKIKVEDKVRSINGVRNVSNNINVINRDQKVSMGDRDYNRSMMETDSKYMSDRYASQHDMEINKKIRDVITDKNIQLYTNNGIVTLEGDVHSREDADKLVDKVKHVDGVKQVINNLKINR